MLIPAWHPVLERVYIYKTAHHPRLESDYRQPAVDAAMATAAADVPYHGIALPDRVELVDGGVWANERRRRGGRQGGRRSQLAGRSTESSQHRHATDLLPALDSILGERKLGESKTCLLIPAWHPVLERVYIYKTAHHPRLESDYRQPAVDAAMATAAADVPTTALHCRSGRTCRRRGVGEQPRRRGGRQGGRRLNWPAAQLKVLSIGTITDVKAPPRWAGKLPMATHVPRLFMADQSHSALGTAKIITGHGPDHKAIWRIDQVAPTGRYTLDNAGRIREMKSGAVAEAREQPTVPFLYASGGAIPAILRPVDANSLE